MGCNGEQYIIGVDLARFDAVETYGDIGADTSQPAQLTELAPGTLTAEVPEDAMADLIDALGPPPEELTEALQELIAAMRPEIEALAAKVQAALDAWKASAEEQQ